jgi:hypothetical protein
MRWNDPLKFIFFLVGLLVIFDHVCGLVVRVPGYRSGGPGFDSQGTTR